MELFNFVQNLVDHVLDALLEVLVVAGFLFDFGKGFSARNVQPDCALGVAFNSEAVCVADLGNDCLDALIDQGLSMNVLLVLRLHTCC